MTTMWETLKDQDVGKRRRLVIERRWGEMIDKGSAVVCHNGTQESAWSVVRALLG